MGLADGEAWEKEHGTGTGLTRWESQLHELIRDAIDHGVTPREMVLEMQECWDVVLHDAKKYAAREFNDLLATKVSN